MITAKTGEPAHLETIDEVDKELTRVIEDFDRAVNIEALRLAKRIGKHPLSESGNSSISVMWRRTSRTGASRA